MTAWLPNRLFFFKAVNDMYVYEGRDYRETSKKDQEAFDNMVAGKKIKLNVYLKWSCTMLGGS